MAQGRQALRLWSFVEPICSTGHGTHGLSAPVGSITQRWSHAFASRCSTSRYTAIEAEAAALLQRQRQRLFSNAAAGSSSSRQHGLGGAAAHWALPRAAAQQCRSFASSGGRNAYSDAKQSSIALQNRNLSMYMVRCSTYIACVGGENHQALCITSTRVIHHVIRTLALIRAQRLWPRLLCSCRACSHTGASCTWHAHTRALAQSTC
jgi:hypothetical protein